MLNRNIKIWIGLSAISIAMLLFWKHQSMDIVSETLTKNDAYFQQIANNHSETILETINLHVQAYPEYREYYVYAKGVDSLSKIALRNIETADLKEQGDYIVDSLLYEYLDKEELSQFASIIYDFSNEELAQRQLQGWSLNFSKLAMIQKNKIALFNFYAERVGSSWHYYDSNEPIFTSKSINAFVNEKYSFQIGMGKSSIVKLKDEKIWINGEAYKTDGWRIRYKTQATKSGWNDLKIKFQGEYKNQIFTDSLTHRYFVCN